MKLSNGFHVVPPSKIAAVVTSLEMFAPPSFEGSDSTSAVDCPWSLMFWERPDVEAYRRIFREIGEHWLWFSRLTMSDSDLRAILEHPQNHVYILRRDGQEAGLLELDFRTPEECELAFLGVLPRFIGQGAGRWMLGQAFQLAWGPSSASPPARPAIRRLWTHTCTLDHPAALGLYLRAGFRAFRRQVEIDDDPRLSGALSRDAAPQIPLL